MCLQIFSKTEKYWNEHRGVNIDQIAMCYITYISMDLSLQALQTYGKLFFKFIICFEFLDKNWNILKRIARREY